MTLARQPEPQTSTPQTPDGISGSAMVPAASAIIDGLACPPQVLPGFIECFLGQVDEEAVDNTELADAARECRGAQRHVMTCGNEDVAGRAGQG